MHRTDDMKNTTNEFIYFIRCTCKKIMRLLNYYIFLELKKKDVDKKH